MIGEKVIGEKRCAGPRVAGLREAILELAPELATGMRVDEPLSRHTSMRVGGPADLFCAIQSEAQLALVIREARRRAVPVFVLGSGTNLVVSDRGIRGMTVKLGRGFHRTEWLVDAAAPDRARVSVGAGVPFKRLVLDTVDRGFTGLEFGEGIPGTVGGGVLMNAGAFGGEIGDVTTALRGVDREGDLVRMPRERLVFSYRRLELPAGFVVTGLDLELRRGESRTIEAAVADAKRRRGTRQPLGLPNAGSIFKNPAGDFAGRLIERAELKGAMAGRAQISPRHANFIVNLGEARAADVVELIGRARDAVWRQRGVWLEPEVRLVGEWA